MLEVVIVIRGRHLGCGGLACAGLFALACRPTAPAQSCPDAVPTSVRDLELDDTAGDRKARPASRLSTPPQTTTADASPMLAMMVVGVLRDGAGQDAVVLLEPESRLVVPIWIGPSESMAIALRLSGERYPRPLTHDLLDSVIAHAKLRIQRVEIDGLEDSTFLAHIVMVDANAESVRIDARPSDAMALAVGSGAPIYMAKAVLERAGHRPEELGLDPADLEPPRPPNI